MEYVNIGKLVNTHGIKGEVRILSNFKYKELVFKKDFKLYLGKDKKEVIINQYRIHKMFDMVTLEGFNDINEVLPFKGMNVYIKREDLNVSYLNEELIGFDVYDQGLDKTIGKLTDIKQNVNQELLVINNNVYIPNVDEFVKKIDLDKKVITVVTIGGMLDEN